MISVTLLTKDSEKWINRVLESVAWAAEVVVLDSGSTDHTLDIAETFPNVVIHRSEFVGFGPLKNRAAELATHDWILSVDSDEVVSPELAKELQDLGPDPKRIYRMRRRNYLGGKWIRWCGWHPDRVIRFYNRGETRFSSSKVHERVKRKKLKMTDLTGQIDHYSYSSTSDFLTKMEHYTTLWAEQHASRRKGSFARALLHKWYTFVRSYILRRGFMGGAEGYIISSYQAETAFYKYLKLKELQEDRPPVREKLPKAAVQTESADAQMKMEGA
jgi:glycosyltransferase involved in cell wall biosynthesis